MPSVTRCRYSFACPSTNVNPMTNVSANHRRSPCTSPRSARNTPSWQVIDESTRIVVNTRAYGISSFSVCTAHSWGAAARIEKYIAKSAAKNISSLESHTIVPTLTMLGRVSEWIWLLAIAGAVVTASLLPPIKPRMTLGRVVAHDVGSLRVSGPDSGARRRGRAPHRKLHFEPALLVAGAVLAARGRVL